MKLKLANGALLYIFHWKRHYGHDLDRSLQFSKHAIFSSKMAMIMISPISNGTSIDAVFIVISLGNFRFVNVVIQSTMQNCRSFLASSHFLKFWHLSYQLVIYFIQLYTKRFSLRCRLHSSFSLNDHTDKHLMLIIFLIKKYIPYLYFTKLSLGGHFFSSSSRQVTSTCLFAWKSAIEYFCDLLRLPFIILDNENLDQKQHTGDLLLWVGIHLRPSSDMH